MIAYSRYLRVLIAAFAPVLGAVLLLSVSPEAVHAIPSTLCVAPGGTGCDAGTCGGTCYASVQDGVDAAITGDDIRVATGVYTGVHARGGMTQVVYISKTVAIRGGYSSDLTMRDLDLYPSTLDAERQGRVVSIVSAGAVTLEGLNITGGNGHGMTATCPAVGGQPDGCGGGIFAYASSPMILDNVISDNVAGTSVGSRQVGGGGLCRAHGTGGVIRGNLFLSNTASLGARGIGGGALLVYGTNISVTGNRFLSNTGTVHNSLPGLGGGLATGGSSLTGTVQGNLFQGNRTNGSGTYFGGATYQWSSNLQYYENHATGSYGESTVYVEYGKAWLEGNYVVDNATATGIDLKIRNVGELTLVNNVVARSGDASVRLYATKTYPGHAFLLHNTLVGTGTGDGVQVSSAYVTVSLTNTIVASHSWGITNTFPASSTVYADHTLFYSNHDDGIVGTNPVYGDPAFVDAAAGDFHLGGGSAAIDAGVEAGVTTDIEGTERPRGAAPDIGAYEAWVIFLPLVLRGP